ISKPNEEVAIAPETTTVIRLWRKRSALWTKRAVTRDRFQHAPDVVGENFLTRGVWMHPVRLIEKRIAADAFEQIGNERGVIFRCEIGVNLSESENVIVRAVVWQLHSGNDDSHVRILRFHLVDDRLQIISNFHNRRAAKSVVNSELENKDVDLVFEMCGQTLQPAGSCSAALAGVRDFKF